MLYRAELSTGLPLRSGIKKWKVRVTLRLPESWGSRWALRITLTLPGVVLSAHIELLVLDLVAQLVIHGLFRALLGLDAHNAGIAGGGDGGILGRTVLGAHVELKFILIGTLGVDLEGTTSPL